ncbi:MAG: hypothetical protein BWY71_01541 [Planctomycetes bacterium ADurb.Bin412]|nr:MAG: hypothetical protein BWY71_01541 [Planctomycetes bacterium ADurb.Bin412]
MDGFQAGKHKIPLGQFDFAGMLLSGRDYGRGGCGSLWVSNSGIRIFIFRMKPHIPLALGNG